jgi:hypothetical protein
MTAIKVTNDRFKLTVLWATRLSEPEVSVSD